MNPEKLRSLIRELLREVLVELYEKTKNGGVREGVDSAAEESIKELSPDTYDNAANKRRDQSVSAAIAGDTKSANKLGAAANSLNHHARANGPLKQHYAKKQWEKNPVHKGRLLSKEEKLLDIKKK